MFLVLSLSQIKNKNSSDEGLTSPPTVVTITLSTSVDKMHCSTSPPHVDKCYSFYGGTPLYNEIFLAILFLSFFFFSCSTFLCRDNNYISKRPLYISLTSGSGSAHFQKFIKAKPRFSHLRLVIGSVSLL